MGISINEPHSLLKSKKKKAKTKNLGELKISWVQFQQN